MPATLGELSVAITANIEPLRRRLLLAARFLRAFERGVSKAGKDAAKALAPLNGVLKETATKARDARHYFSQFGDTVKKTRPKLAEVEAGMRGIVGQMSRWIKFNLTWFATWRLMWTVLRAIKAGTRAIIDFDTALVDLRAITGATHKEMAVLEETARKVGETTRFTAAEAALAMRDLAKAGFSVAEVNKMILPVTEFAIASISDLATASGVLTSVLRTWNLTADKAREVADVFTAAIVSSRVNVDYLKDSLKYVGPVAAAVGVPIEDTAALLGVLADRGISASMAGTGLRMMFRMLLAPTERFRAELRKAQLEVADISPLTQDFATILDRLQKSGFNVERAMRGMRARVATTAAALITAGAPAFVALRDAVTDSGASAVIAREQQESLGYLLKELASVAVELALKFKDLLLPIFGELIRLGRDVLKVFGGLVELLDTFVGPLFEFIAERISLARDALRWVISPAKEFRQETERAIMGALPGMQAELEGLEARLEELMAERRAQLEAQKEAQGKLQEGIIETSLAIEDRYRIEKAEGQVSLQTLRELVEFRRIELELARNTYIALQKQGAAMSLVEDAYKDWVQAQVAFATAQRELLARQQEIAEGERRIREESTAAFEAVMERMRAAHEKMTADRLRREGDAAELLRFQYLKDLENLRLTEEEKRKVIEESLVDRNRLSEEYRKLLEWVEREGVRYVDLSEKQKLALKQMGLENLLLLLEESHALELERQRQFSAEIQALREQEIAAFVDSWARWIGTTKDWAVQWARFLQNTIETFVSNAIDQMFGMGKSWKEIWADLGKAFVKMIAMMMAKLLAFKALMLVLPAGWAETLRGILGFKEGGIALKKAQKGLLLRRPTLLLAGEAGPEIIAPLSKLGEILETYTKKGYGGSETINVNVSLVNPVVDDELFWDRVVRENINPAIERNLIRWTTVKEVALGE